MPQLGRLEANLASTLSLIQNEIGPQGENFRAAIQTVENVKSELVRVGTILGSHGQRIEKLAEETVGNTSALDMTRATVARIAAQPQPGPIPTLQRQPQVPPVSLAQSNDLPLPAVRQPMGRTVECGRRAPCTYRVPSVTT